MNEKHDLLEKIYTSARIAGKCKTQKEFAELIGIHPSTLSLALSGDERYLTDKLMRMVTQWARLEGMEEKAVAVQQDTRPDIRIPAATMDLYTSMAKSIDRLTSIVERLQPGASAFAGAAVTAPKNYRVEE